MFFYSLKKNLDPWGRKKNHKSELQFNKNNDSPPDLDEIFKNLFNKFFIRNGNNQKNKKISNQYFLIPLLFILFLWIFSGFYTIKEAEKGVVLRFGKFNHVVHPGLNWKPTFIDTVIPVNVESVKELAASGIMLTSDENVLRVEMNVQYQITNPKCYLFSVTNADYSLRQATDSALRGVIGKYTMDTILTEGRTLVRNDTHRILEETIRPYNMGITLLDVNFQIARPPEEVKAAFDDAIAARENEQQYIREAEAYVNEVQPRAKGKAQRILEEGKAYKEKVILEAQGKVKRFSKILKEYEISPEITKNRLYIHTMENIFKKTKKIFFSSNLEKNIFFVPVNLVKKECIDLNKIYKPIQDKNKIYDFKNKKKISKKIKNKN